MRITIFTLLTVAATLVTAEAAAEGGRKPWFSHFKAARSNDAAIEARHEHSHDLTNGTDITLDGPHCHTHNTGDEAGENHCMEVPGEGEEGEEHDEDDGHGHGEEEEHCHTHGDGSEHCGSEEELEEEKRKSNLSFFLLYPVDDLNQANPHVTIATTNGTVTTAPPTSSPTESTGAGEGTGAGVKLAGSLGTLFVGAVGAIVLAL